MNLAMEHSATNLEWVAIAVLAAAVCAVAAGCIAYVGKKNLVTALGASGAAFLAVIMAIEALAGIAR